MIDRRQVVQVRVGVPKTDGSGRFVGTGFLVAPGKLVTALHVIAQLDDNGDVERDMAGQPIPLMPIECLYFTDSDQYQSERVKFDPDRDDHDIDEDWVVLPVKSAPASTVWRCRPLESTDRGAECWAYVRLPNIFRRARP